jgi:hypothetical protein
MKPRYTKHWNEISANWQQTDQQVFQRSFSDLLNLRLFDDWLPFPKTAERLLKTYLFDESLLVTLDNKTNPIICLRNLLPYKLLHKLGFFPYYVGTTLSACSLKKVLQELNFSVLGTRAFWHFPRIIMVGLTLFIHRLLSDKSKKAY